MNQLAIVVGLLFFIITALPLTKAQNEFEPELDFRFTYLISDKSLYVGGEIVEFEAYILNNSTNHDLSVFIVANSPFLNDRVAQTDDSVTSETIIIPRNEEASIKILLPSEPDKYGKQILRISAYGTSTTDESISDEDHTLFQVTFEDKPVSRLPIIGFLIVVAIVAGFVLRSTRSEHSDL